MNLKEQQYICTIADCKNITKAAEKLFITQPALSLYINNLEKILGTRLFDRVEKQFLLTPAGELYVEKAREMLRLQREFETGLCNLANHINGSFTVGVQLRRAPLLLPTAIARFKKLYPNIRVNIKEGVKTDLETYIHENKVELLIYNSPEPKDFLENQLLYKDMPLLAVPADHPINHCAVPIPDSPYPYLDLKHCQDEFFILPTKKQSLRTYVDRTFASYHFTTCNYIEIRNFETAMGFVNEGLGLGFNREQYTHSMTHLTNLSYYAFTKGCDCRICVFAGYRKKRELPEYIQHFIRLLTERGQEIEAMSLKV